MQKKTGISLIVLVITIIVMIILAAAIIISLNNTGIINNANTAKTKTDDKLIREAIEVAKLNLNFEGNLNKDTLQNELQKSLGVDVEVINNMDKSYTIKVKDMYYTLEEDETVVSGIYDKWDKTSTEPTQTTNEIHIYKASELKWLEEQVNGGEFFEGYTIYLENNLDFGARENEGTTLDEKWKTTSNKEYKWTPIGKEIGKDLKAKFDGKNHIIKGIYVEETTKYNGIFGRSNNTICNLTIKNSYIEGGQNTAGIIARAGDDCDVINCHNVNTTVVLTSGDNYIVGGVVGTVRKSVKNCTNSGTVIANGTINKEDFANNISYAGGIASSIEYDTGIIENCINTGHVISKGAIAGGIAAGTRGSIINCTNNGLIEAGNDSKGRSRCGGIVGGIQGKILECANYGKVSATGLQIGGIAGVLTTYDGVSNSVVDTCFNTGKIEGNKYVGGIVGHIANDKVNYCYNKGTVTGNTKIGSIIGINESTTSTIGNLYYLNTLNLKAIGNIDYVDKNVTSTTKNINSFEEFKVWISQFK